MTQAAQFGGDRGTFLGIPLRGFGLLTSVVLSIAAGFLVFFATTCVAIFVLLGWNLGGGHAVNYADSYLYVGFPAGSAALVVALAIFLTLWARTKFQK